MEKPRGFTLVELLVVIGIIALLISILLPSLARARQAAVTLQCLSNLRTIGQGFLLYQQDSKGSYPFGMRNNPVAGAGWMAWPTVTSKYLGASDTGSLSPFNNVQNNASMGVFQCPGRIIEVGNPADLHSTYVGHPIVLSSSEFVNFAACTFFPAGGRVKTDLWTYKAVWMKDAANKVVVMDGSQLLPDAVSENGYTWPVGNRMDTRADGGSNFPALTGGTEHAAAGFDYNQPAYVANNNQDVTNRSWTSARYRHGGDTQCNFLFGDGHAETRSYNRGTGRSEMTSANFSVNFPLAKQ